MRNAQNLMVFNNYAGLVLSAAPTVGLLSLCYRYVTICVRRYIQGKDNMHYHAPYLRTSFSHSSYTVQCSVLISATITGRFFQVVLQTST